MIKSITKTINESYKNLYENLLLEDIDAVKRQYSHIPENEFDEIIKLK